ncbi:hypothetical protein FB45DRAFT_939443 [Roridomyces roridus]|uniref:BTB domain-containing protein n=1 Tax=Roridomyces roridus TaxID=1738132 RepID=A0AAD7B793_9AGAR|nr:hypothetical protein FB45DRAFT_939443 [Roridomyces roridus]
MAFLMIKSSGDELTLNGVKSTFTIDIPQERSTDVAGALTPVCGWGWRFSCSVDSEANSSSPRLLDDDFRPVPWRRLTLFFHPDLIRSAAYGHITFSVAVENLNPLDDTPVWRDYDLPTNDTSATIGVYIRRRAATGPATISISVEFPTSLGISLTRPLDGRAETALAETIHGKEIVDVKFYAYSRVGESYVARPRPMFAKMSLLKGHSVGLDEYLDTKGFKESKLVDLDADEVQHAEELFTDYDYMSDSDLDSDVDDEEDNVQTSEPQSEPDPQASSSRTLLPSPRRMGQVVFIKGHAYNTWNALLYYLYTKKIEFRAPGERGPAEESATPKCSPKSMYKLADYLELTELKSLALASLRSQLTTGNIVREAFSTFTSMFTEIQDLEVEFLLGHLSELGPDMATMLQRVCKDYSPHCFSVLWKVACRTPMDFIEIQAPIQGEPPVKRGGKKGLGKKKGKSTGQLTTPEPTGSFFLRSG